jgi:hypothetical protein
VTIHSKNEFYGNTHRLLLSVKLSFTGSSLALSVLANPLAKPPLRRLYPVERKRWAKYKKPRVRRGVNILGLFQTWCRYFATDTFYFKS